MEKLKEQKNKKSYRNWFNFEEKSLQLKVMKCPHCKKLISIDKKTLSKIKIEKW